MPFAAQDLDGIVTVNLGSKGVIELELVSSGEKWGRGPAKDIHSSLKAMVDSPAWHLVKALNTLVSDDGNVIMIDNYPKPLPPTAEEKTMIEKVSKTRSEALAKKQFSVQHWINDLPWEQANERLESQPTVNIEGLVGGYTGPGGKTVLPHRAVAKIDMRLVPDMKAADALAALKAHLAKRGFGDIEVNMTGGYDPTATSKDSALIQAQLATYKRFGIDAVALAAQRRFVSRLRLHRRTAKAGGRTFRSRPRQRRARARRILHHRIHEPEDPRLRWRDDVVCRISIRVGKIACRGARPRDRGLFCESASSSSQSRSRERLFRRDAETSTRALPRTVPSYNNFASRLICAPASTTETGQVFWCARLAREISLRRFPELLLQFLHRWW